MVMKITDIIKFDDVDILDTLSRMQALCRGVSRNPRYKAKDRKEADALYQDIGKCLCSLGEFGEVVWSDEKEGMSLQVLNVGMIAAHTRRGKKVQDAAKEGHAAVHGTSEEKQKRYRRYQQAIDMYMKQNPAVSYERACSRVALAEGVHTITVKRHTIRPKKK
ncbi:MAG: hypothetical protein A2Z25_09850 [Planctomycetes bacterium RBG_16_55_9]|jgi:hypothetical protein|nr:MAG: hypothetical protein A2Z25_09850 [Planctomycetes bacterium RBG_16_55_9]